MASVVLANSLAWRICAWISTRSSLLDTAQLPLPYDDGPRANLFTKKTGNRKFRVLILTEQKQLEPVGLTCLTLPAPELSLADDRSGRSLPLQKGGLRDPTGEPTVGILLSPGARELDGRHRGSKWSPRANPENEILFSFRRNLRVVAFPLAGALYAEWALRRTF